MGEREEVSVKESVGGRGCVLFDCVCVCVCARVCVRACMRAKLQPITEQRWALVLRVVWKQPTDS